MTFPPLQAKYTTNPKIVPQSMDNTVMIIVLIMPSTNSRHLSSRINVRLKLAASSSKNVGVLGVAWVLGD